MEKLFVEVNQISIERNYSKEFESSLKKHYIPCENIANAEGYVIYELKNSSHKKRAFDIKDKIYRKYVVQTTIFDNGEMFIGIR